MNTATDATQSLVTREQLAHLFAAWGVGEKPPGKGKKVLVSFPRSMPFALATIEPHPLKSTYGKALFSVRFSNP